MFWSDVDVILVEVLQVAKYLAIKRKDYFRKKNIIITRNLLLVQLLICLVLKVLVVVNSEQKILF